MTEQAVAATPRLVAEYIAAHIAADAVQPSRSVVYRVAKRTLDLAIGIPALLLSLPVQAVIAVVLRLESPGPAIFRQWRVGQDGRLIRFYKFRTMYIDARERFPEAYRYAFSDEEFQRKYYKPVQDARNTRFGAWLRRSTLDELPNLFNVVKGNVSLVGPRPELVEYVSYYTPRQLTKFTVKSGVTGLAQCAGRNTLSIQQQIEHDVEYVRRMSFWFDVRLLGRTFVAVLKREGAE